MLYKEGIHMKKRAMSFVLVGLFGVFGIGCGGGAGSAACVSLCQKYNSCVGVTPGIIKVDDCSKYCYDQESKADSQGCRTQYDASTACSNAVPASNLCQDTSCSAKQTAYNQCAAGK